VVTAIGVCSRAVSGVALGLVLALSPWGHAVVGRSPTRAAAEAREDGASRRELDEAAAAFARGVEAYKQGRYDEAALQFSRAQELAPHPDTLFNLGLAQQRAERHTDAWRSFEALLPLARDEQEREDVLAAQAASRAHVAWVRVIAEPGDALVCFDGEPMPLDEHGRRALLTTPGQHRLDVDREQRTLELEGGESRTVEVMVTPLAPPPPPRKTLRTLAGLALGGAGAATGAGLGAAFVRDPEAARMGLGLGAAAAGSIAVATTVAALAVHRRARRRTPPPPLRRCPK
jgi:tetratricopeptide (TPR) repeat protein